MNDNDAEKKKRKDGESPAESPLDIDILEEYHAGKGTKQHPTDCPTDS